MQAPSTIAVANGVVPAVPPGLARTESADAGRSPVGDEQGDEAHEYEEFGHGSNLAVVGFSPLGAVMPPTESFLPVYSAGLSDAQRAMASGGSDKSVEGAEGR